MTPEASAATLRTATRPGFFVVGAAKCGTTTLHHVLSQHPGIFMPRLKEPHYFDTDLHPYPKIATLDDYLALFADAGAGQIGGEASPSYLYSRSAPAAIRAFAADARIIMVLRNPVDAMHSSHSHNLFSGNEDVADFESALTLEEDRRHGRNLPRNCRFIETLFYRDRYRYVCQVRRYLETFGRSHVLIILYEDLRDRLPAVFAETARFLGVDPKFQPNYSVANANRTVRDRRLHGLVLKFSDTSAWKRVKRWIPLDVWRLYCSLNVATRPRSPMPDELRERLVAEFAPEVAELSRLIGRDLDAWR